MDTAAVYNVGSLKATGNAEIQGVLTVDNVAAGALSCSRAFTALSGQNSITMTQTKTTVAGPITFVGAITGSSLDIAGSVSGDGFSAFFDSYSVASLGKQENLLIVSPPLLKTAVGEKTQLSLNTFGDYSLGTLYIRGATTLHVTSLGDVAIID